MAVKTIPYMQHVKVHVAEAPLPCIGACGMVTAHDIIVESINAVVGVIHLSYTCSVCGNRVEGRHGIAEDFG